MRCPWSPPPVASLGLGLMFLGVAGVPGGVFAFGTSNPPDSGPAHALLGGAANYPASETRLGVVPDWMEIDRSANTVRLEIVAGASDPNNRWNFNGYARGQATITVPRGYEITIEFRNDDSDVPHSLGVGELPDSSFPPMFEDPQPVFEGAISASPTSMTESALPGESETVTFTADEAGEYALLCYIPAHAVTGMWIRFVVSGDGEAGFEADTDGGSQRSRAGSGAGRRRSW